MASETVFKNEFDAINQTALEQLIPAGKYIRQRSPLPYVFIHQCSAMFASWVGTESSPRDAAFRFCHCPRDRQSSARVSRCDGTRARSSASVASPHAEGFFLHHLSHNTGALRRVPYPRSLAFSYRQSASAGVRVHVPRAREFSPMVRRNDHRIISRNPRAALVRECQFDQGVDR